MTFLRTSARVLAAAALAGLYACAGSSTASGPTASLTLLPSSNSVRNDGVPVTILASAVTAAGTAGTGTVTFVAAFGTLSATTATLDTAGTASVSYNCNIAVDSRCVAGNVFINGSWSSAGKSVQLSVQNVAPGAGGGTPPPPTGGGGTPPPPTGTPPGAPSSISVTASGPFVLGLKGSGIQEHGSISYLVTDSLGIPVPGMTVNFAVQAPVLGLTLLHPSAVSDLNGVASAAYTSGTQVGVTAITATVATTGATVSQAVAVRGAKPSANGFYFRCEHASLPVYTTIGEFETMTCSVRLTDRYGNRVGIPTVVSFATEAGAIAASVTTKGFDVTHQNDPAEGTGTVTFTSDTGNGNSPADVVPLGPAAQFPFARGQEPSRTIGSLTLNPRDQLVTIIAMTRGEEAFEDADGDGVFTAGEAFVDQGDPFVDADDNGAYDAAPVSGLPEIRFCGLNADCSTYHGPNGTWDADTVIWKPTWVVFAGAGAPSGIPNTLALPFAPSSRIFDTGTTPGTDCAEYVDAAFNASHSSTISATVYAYDLWLNLPAAGTTTAAGTPTSDKLNAKLFGFGTLLESWGSMGVLGFDFDWVRVSAANNAVGCSAATSPCIEKLVFGDFLAPPIGSILIENTTKTPTASDPLGAGSLGCPSNPPAATPPPPDAYGFAAFQIDVTVTSAHDVKATALLAGRYARGTGK